MCLDAILVHYYETQKLGVFLYCVLASNFLFSEFPCPGIYSNVRLSLPNFFVDSHQIHKEPIKMQLFRLSFWCYWRIHYCLSWIQTGRGILVICENDLKFYLSSCLFLGHSCGERRKQFSQPLPWTSVLQILNGWRVLQVVYCQKRSHTELVHSKCLLPIICCEAPVSRSVILCQQLKWFKSNLNMWDFVFIYSFYVQWFFTYLW